MPALVAATVAALEMIGRRKDGVAEFIEVIVGFRRRFDRFDANRRAHFLQDGIDVIPIARKPGNGLQACSAEAGGIGGGFRQPSQHGLGHDNLMAPARSLVEISPGHMTGILPTAKRTPFGLTGTGRGSVARGVLGRFVHALDGCQALGVVMPRWYMYLPARSA